MNEKYRIPDEAPRGRFTRFAVRASAPYWAAYFIGTLPALVWSALNAYFLGCRDARRQALMAASFYPFIAAIGALRLWVIDNLAQRAHVPKEIELAIAVLGTLFFLATLLALRLLVIRQVDLSDYRRALGGKQSWGLLPIALLAGFSHYILPLFIDMAPPLLWIWGRFF